MLFKNTFVADFEAVQAKENDFQLAFTAANMARNKRGQPRAHRAIASLKVTPYLLSQSIALPIVFVALIYWGQPLIFSFWMACIEFWSLHLAFPLTIATTLSETGPVSLHVFNDQTSSELPSFNTLAFTAITTLLGFALSLRLHQNVLPLKYPLRIVCVVQFAALLYFWLFPSKFLYRIADHSEELFSIGYVVMLATPVMLALGYYILNEGLFKKILNTLLILVFLGIMIPHQVLAHALILSQVSVLFMPVLYLCFGAVFDALVFIALYSWIVSNTTIEATT